MGILCKVVDVRECRPYDFESLFAGKEQVYARQAGKKCTRHATLEVGHQVSWKGHLVSLQLPSPDVMQSLIESFDRYRSEDVVVVRDLSICGTCNHPVLQSWVGPSSSPI